MKVARLVGLAITLSLSLLAWSNNKLPDGRTFLRMCLEEDQYSAVFRLKKLLKGSNEDSRRDWLNSVEFYQKSYFDSYLGSSSEASLTHNTPLHIAASNGCSGMVLTLLNYGAKVDAKDFCYDQTPLHMAVKNGHSHVVIRLLAYGANVEARSMEERTAMHWAALGKTNAHRSIISLLMAHRADIEAKDYDGHTPLSIAVDYNGNIKTVEHLIAFGANQTRVFRGIKTNLILAFRHENKELVRVLLEYLPDTEEKHQYIHFHGNTANEEFRPWECRGTAGHQEPKELPTAIELAQNHPEILALLHTPPVYNAEKVQRHRIQCTPNLQSRASFRLWLAFERSFTRMLQYLNSQPQFPSGAISTAFFSLGFVRLYENVQAGIEEVYSMDQPVIHNVENQANAINTPTFIIAPITNPPYLYYGNNFQ